MPAQRIQLNPASPTKRNKPDKCILCNEDLEEGILNQHTRCTRNILVIQDVDEPRYTRQADGHFHCKTCEYRSANRVDFKQQTHVTESHAKASAGAPHDIEMGNEAQVPMLDSGRSPEMGNEAQVPMSDSGRSPEMGNEAQVPMSDSGRSPEMGNEAQVPMSDSGRSPEMGNEAQVPMSDSGRSPTPGEEECDHFLRNLGLVVHRDLLICPECKTVVEHTDIRRHINANHGELDIPKSLKTDFDTIVLSRYPNLISKPEHPLEPVEKIPYLETKFAYIRCVSCNRCYNSPGGRHADPITYDCQRYIPNTSSPWFPLKKSAPTPFDMTVATPLQIYQNSRSHHATVLDGSQIDEVRILHQFLYKEGWISAIDTTGLPRSSLIRYARLEPKDPVLLKLSSVIYKFLKRVQDTLLHTALRRLVGLRPASEHERTFMRHHSSVSNPTLKRYARTAVGFIELIRRSNADAYPFKVPEAILKSAQDLFALVSQADTEPLEGFDEAEDVPLADLVLDEDGEPLDDSPMPLEPDNLIGAPNRSETSAECALINLLELIYTSTPTTAKGAPMHSPVMQFLLLSSVRDSGAWATTTSITQKIAASTFVGRLTFAHLITQTSIKGDITTHEAFNTYERYFLERSEAVMPSLYILHRGLSSIASAEESGTVLSSPSWDVDAVTIGESTVFFTQIGEIITSLHEEIEVELRDVLFNSDAHTQFAEVEILDKPRCAIPGFSFIDHVGNPWHKIPTLMDHILRTPSLFKEFGLGLGNYPGGSIRNVFSSFKHSSSEALTTRRRSSQERIASSPSAASFHLPPFHILPCLCRPLFSEFQLLLRPHMHHNSYYFLFCGLHRPVTSVDLSKAMSEITLAKLHIAIPISLHRQIMAFITSRYRRAFPAGTVSSATDEQLGHSETVDRKHYGLDASIPGQMDHDSLLTSLEVSGIFHKILLGDTVLLQSVYAQQAHVQDLVHDLDSIRAGRRDHGPSGEASGHPGNSNDSQCIASGNPRSIARSVTQQLAPFLNQQMKETVERANAAIVHLFAPDRIRRQHPCSPICSRQCSSPLIPRVRQVIRDPPHVTFSNIHQAQATQLCIEKERSFLLVTPTGSGKTYPPLIASRWYDKGSTTVWLLPMLSMREQLVKRVRSRGFPLSCTTRHPHRSTPSNLIVSIESTAKEEFTRYLEQLCATQSIARFVLDEAHLLLTHESFRPIMNTLSGQVE
ncbi:hypothetical protein DFP72DRAFT_858702, partial [Ephemerocybe angulata]